MSDAPGPRPRAQWWRLSAHPLIEAAWITALARASSQMVEEGTSAGGRNMKEHEAGPRRRITRG